MISTNELRARHSGQALFQYLVAADMPTVVEELEKTLADREGLAGSLAVKALNSGGKRLRPILVLLSACCFGKAGREVRMTAVAAELIHLASLVHDDVLDNSNLRRGQPTLNYLFNNHTAVLTGDFLFARAFKLLAEEGLFDILKIMLHAISEMCDGEVSQDLQAFDLRQTINQYMKRVEQKTGALTSACCHAGALAGGASPEAAQILAQYGLYLGTAFQLVDDILDLTGNPGPLGKPTWSDLKTGNLTLPVLLLREHQEYGPWVMELLAQKDGATREQDKLRKVLETSGVLDQAANTARKIKEAALSALSPLPASIYRDALFELAEFTLTRSH